MGNGQLAANNNIDAVQPTPFAVNAGTPRSGNPLQVGIWPGPKPVPKPKPTLVAANAGWLTDLSWRQHDGNFANSHRWINMAFAFNLDGYIETAREDFTTDHNDVLSESQYGPDIVDEAAINVSVDANKTVIDHHLKCLTTSFGKVSFGVSHSQKDLSRKRCRRDIVKADQKIRFHDILPVLRLRRALASTHAW